MRKLLIIAAIVLFVGTSESFSQRIGAGDNFGFGIILGEPTGLTLKYYTERYEAFAFSLGPSYFGSPRLGADYIWHFHAFESQLVHLYAGPGLVLGFGEGEGFWYKERGDRFFVRSSSDLGLGVRGVFGINFLLKSAPLEFFGELGVLVGFAPEFGSAVDAAIGMRFYP